jgi:hypothetical protein
MSKTNMMVKHKIQVSIKGRDRLKEATKELLSGVEMFCDWPIGYMGKTLLKTHQIVLKYVHFSISKFYLKEKYSAR